MLWEDEEPKNWSKVLTKRQKCLASKSANSPKKVRFAERIIQASLVIKHHPVGIQRTIKIGNLDVQLPCFDSSVLGSHSFHGILKKSLDFDEEHSA
jgi:hypothetical protein